MPACFDREPAPAATSPTPAATSTAVPSPRAPATVLPEQPTATATTAPAGSPNASPSPATTPTVDPAALFPMTGQAQFISRDSYEQVVAELPPDAREAQAPAIIAAGQARSVQPGAPLRPVFALAPDPGALPPDSAARERLAALEPTGVYLNAIAARTLEAGPGEKLDLYLGVRPTEVLVKDVLPPDVLPQPHPTLYLTLDSAQILLGRPDQVNAVVAAGTNRPGAGILVLPLPMDPARLAAALAP